VSPPHADQVSGTPIATGKSIIHRDLGAKKAAGATPGTTASGNTEYSIRGRKPDRSSSARHPRSGWRSTGRSPT